MSKNLYKRGENWYADFTFMKVRRRFLVGPSAKGAEKIISKIKADIAENKFLDKRQELKLIPFHEFAISYLQWAKVNKKPLSYRQNIYQMRRLEETFSKKNFQEIMSLEIERYKMKRKAEVGPSAVNGELRLLKHMFTMAVQWGKMKEHPGKAVKLLKGEKQRDRFLTHEEAQRLISNCVEPLRSIVMVALNTGMRRLEILSLKWLEVNFDQKLLTVLDSKNHEVRKIPMNGTVQGVLKKLPHHREFVFSHLNGKPYTSIQKAFNHAKAKAGLLDNVVFHSLRHTFASWLVMAGVDITTVMKLLGHRSLSVTMRYSHLSPSHQSKAVNVLDNIEELRTAQKPHQLMQGKNVVSIGS
jgi:integrase